MPSIISGATRAAVEGFVGMNSAEHRRDTYINFLSIMFAFIISLILIGFIGKYLWNYVVVELISFAKPAKSFWQIIGLTLFLALVHP